MNVKITPKMAKNMINKWVDYILDKCNNLNYTQEEIKKLLNMHVHVYIDTNQRIWEALLSFKQYRSDCEFWGKPFLTNKQKCRLEDIADLSMYLTQFWIEL